MKEKRKNYGTCVEVRERLNGTAKFRFTVRRNCPAGWKPSIPILVDGRDSVILSQMTLTQEKAVEERADDLYRQLEAMRAAEAEPMGVDLVPADRSWPRLIELRRQHSKWLNLKPASQSTYKSTQKRLVECFGRDPALAPSVVLESQIDPIVRARFHSAHQRKKAYLEIRVLLNKAIREGWRAAGLGLVYSAPLPKAAIRLWSADDLRCAVTAAIQTGERGLARLLITQWEIGQRLQSVRHFRYGVHYRDGVFNYLCVKGERPISIEVLNPTARRVLDDEYREGALMFPRAMDGKAFTGPELSKAYTRIRKSIPGFDPKLQLRQLRHTVICHLADADCNVLEIATVTSHELDTVHRTLNHYWRPDSDMARRAMEKRERRRLENVAGMTGEIIIEGTRRIFIGDKPQALIPGPSSEKAPDEA